MGQCYMHKFFVTVIYLLAAGMLLGNALAQDTPAATTPSAKQTPATSAPAAPAKTQTPAAKKPATGTAAKTAATPLTLLTDEEAQAAIMEVQKEMQAKMQEKNKEAADVNKKTGEAFLAANKGKEGVVALPSGLQYKIEKAGTGAKPTANDSVVCNY